MTISDSVIDEILKDYKTPEDLVGKGGIFKELTKRILERAMDGEMDHHLGYAKHDNAGDGSGNSRNGKSIKKIKGEFGEVEIEVPRDRNGDFEPQIIKKGQSRFEGFDDKILYLYASGLSTRLIQEQLKEIYGVDVSPDLISKVTDAVLEDVKAWLNRPLESIYPIVFLDALRVKMRDQGTVKNKAVYIAIGVNREGKKDVLGLWIEQTEGAKFWLGVMTEMKNRGVSSFYIACVDGLKGFPEAIEAVFPTTEIQLCMVHMVRNSLQYVGSKDKARVALELKKIYSASTIESGEAELAKFEKTYGEKYPTIVKSWRRNWERVIPIFEYPPEIRKVIYTTNTIESLNSVLRKTINNKASFPTDEAAVKLLYLAIQRAMRRWTMPLQNWGLAMNQFAIRFEESDI